MKHIPSELSPLQIVCFSYSLKGNQYLKSVSYTFTFSKRYEYLFFFFFFFSSVKGYESSSSLEDVEHCMWYLRFQWSPSKESCKYKRLKCCYKYTISAKLAKQLERDTYKAVCQYCTPCNRLTPSRGTQLAQHRHMSSKFV